MKQKTDISQALNPAQNESRKPSRKELLAELESIHASLIEISATATEQARNPWPDPPDNDKPLPDHLTKSVEFERALRARPQAPEFKIQPEQNNPTNFKASPQQEQNMSLKPAKESTVLPGQQSLFDILPEETAPRTSGTAKSLKKEVSPANVENPFLPSHVKERLAQEKQHYQQDLESVAKLSFGMSNSLSSAQCEELVDTLVAQYLPKIEQDLRNELKKLLEKNHEPG